MNDLLLPGFKNSALTCIKWTYAFEIFAFVCVLVLLAILAAVISDYYRRPYN